MSHKPIGIFDSGLGGLSVMRAVATVLPNEDIIYLGDTARAPYGSRSKSTILQYSWEGADYLARQSVKLIVLACHTVSTLAATQLKNEFAIPVVDMVAATVRLAWGKSKIGLIGTEGTVGSGVYQQAVRGVKAVPCPLLAPLVEAQQLDGENTQQIVNSYLSQLGRIDNLVLGCTHYAFLTRPIYQSLGERVVLLNPAWAVAQEIKEVLSSKRLLRVGSKGRREIIFTGG